MLRIDNLTRTYGNSFEPAEPDLEHLYFASRRYLTFRLSMDNEALAGEQGVPDDGQIAARRALAYEEFASRWREEPGVTHVTHGDHLPTMPHRSRVERRRDLQNDVGFRQARSSSR